MEERGEAVPQPRSAPHALLRPIPVMGGSQQRPMKPVAPRRSGEGRGGRESGPEAGVLLCFGENYENDRSTAATLRLGPRHALRRGVAGASRHCHGPAPPGPGRPTEPAVPPEKAKQQEASSGRTHAETAEPRRAVARQDPPARPPREEGKGSRTKVERKQYSCRPRPPCPRRPRPDLKITPFPLRAPPDGSGPEQGGGAS